MAVENRQTRIPLFAPVETPGSPDLGPLYAYNISLGGVYLKAPGISPGSLALGQGLNLALALPDGGPRLTLGAEVVWVDPSLHSHEGESAVGVGVRFAALDRGAASRLAQLVDSFRYEVLAYGLEDLGVAESALGDLYPVQAVDSPEALLTAAGSGHVGLILLADRPGEETALAALERHLAVGAGRRPPVFYLAASSSPRLEALLDANSHVLFARLPLERAELRSLGRCAVESFVASFQTELLSDELARALERQGRENAHLRERMEGPWRMEGIIGEGPAMRKVFEQIERVAPLSTAVMVLGETGTGKELVVGAIVAHSERKDRPFVVLNCAAFTEPLLDNELFGHARGAYTGADRDRPGLFEAADGGTIFLDEIGEMPPSMQPKLLRVLENGELRRLGESRMRHVDVRVICATHRDLEQLVKEGAFRSDLLYRLRTFVISLPPLRERRDDVPLLADHFLDVLCRRNKRTSRGLTAEAKALLQAHDWPGNARELAHGMERLFVLAGEAQIGAPLVREVLGIKDLEPPQGGRSLPALLEAYERELVAAALDRAGGVVARAARALGLDRSTLSRRLKQLGLRGGATSDPS